MRSSAPGSRSGAVAFACLMVSIVALGMALQATDGFYSPRALLALSLALVACVPGVLLIGSAPADGTRAAIALRVLFAIGVAVHVGALLGKSPGLYVDEHARIGLFKAGVVLEAALAGAGLLGIRVLARIWFPAVLALSLALGVWTLKASPHPRIDVVEVHQSALRALGRGRNPYQITFRNIYGENSGYYNPRMLSGDRVMFGYPYPPLSLLLAAPGQLALKDYRYAELAAWILAAALIGATGRSVLSQLSAVLLATTPRAFFVLEEGWTEPIAVLMLALTTYCMVRRPAWSSWAGGLLAVTKQYLGLAGPLILRFGFTRPGGPVPFVSRAVLAGSAVTLPFAIWNLRAFLDTVVLLQTKEPFRIDSLSYVSWAARAGWGEGSFLWAAGAALVALALVLWLTPNTPAGFAAGLALSTFATFAMGSKAFCNYYFFVIGAMTCALAASAASIGSSGESSSVH